MIWANPLPEFSSGQKISPKILARMKSPPNNYFTEQIVRCPSDRVIAQIIHRVALRYILLESIIIMYVLNNFKGSKL